MIGTIRQRKEELQRLYPVWENDTQWTWLKRNAGRFSDRVFLIDGEQRDTYQDILELAMQVSVGLYTCGVRPGMMAAVDMTNRRELIASVFALSRLGCTAVLVNPKITALERDYVLQRAEAKVLITDRPYKPPGQSGEGLLQVLVAADEDSIKHKSPGRKTLEPGSLKDGCPGHTGQGLSRLAPGRLRQRPIDWEQLLAFSAYAEDRQLAKIREIGRDPGRTSTIMFTSGSASHPKGVMLTDDMLLRSAFATAYTRHMEIGRRIYLPLPLFHAMAYVEGMLAAMTVGGSIVIAKRKCTPMEHLQQMQAYRVNDIVCISSIMIRMMTAASGKDMQFPDMHAAYWAGACPGWVWDAARSFFHITDCGNGYGMTECGSTSHIMSGADPSRLVPVCHGRLKDAGAAAFPKGSKRILSIKIVAEDGTRCGPGEAGEICLKGIAVTKGYYKDPEANARLFDEDGWLHSKDLGRLDREGYLTFLGRMDDQFKVNGENVSPKFVEDVLMQHPNIRYAEVVGICHGPCGEAGAAFVEFYEERADAVPEVWRYIRRELARFQQPEWVFPMKPSQWPKTTAGKVSKKELRKIAEQNRSGGQCV